MIAPGPVRTCAPTRSAAPRARMLRASEPWDDLGRPLHADQHGTRPQDALDGPSVRRRDACADGVVRIVLQPRHDETEVTVTGGRRPPVQLDDRGPVGAR